MIKIVIEECGIITHGDLECVCMSLRILIADDHAIVREGLRAILETNGDFEIVGEANTGREAVEQIEPLCVEVVLMDIGMQDLNGIDVTRQISKRHPKVKVIALSTHDDREYVLGMIQAGAAGYVLKTNVTSELLSAIAAVQRHKRYLSPDVADVVMDGYAGLHFPKGDGHELLAEREVLQLLAEVRISKQIGKQLHIAGNTVDVHRRHIMKKLNLHSVAELTKYAVKHGLTQLGTTQRHWASKEGGTQDEQEGGTRVEDKDGAEEFAAPRFESRQRIDRHDSPHLEQDEGEPAGHDQRASVRQRADERRAG